jgi:uncharacterized membrane protein
MKPIELWGLLAGAYITLAISGKFAYPEFFGKLMMGPMVYALGFMALTFAGYVLRLSIPDWAYLALSVLLLLPLGLPYLVGGLFSMFAVYEIFRRGIERETTLLAVYASVGLVAVAALVFGLPMLKPELRYTSASVFYLLAGDVLAISIAVRPSLTFLMAGLITAVLGASRTVAIAVLGAYLFRAAFDGKLTWDSIKENRAPILIVSLLLLGAFLARYEATLSEYPHWKLGFLGTQLYRLGSTYHVYERLFELGMPLGRHRLLFTPDPTGYVGRLFGKEIGYTYTLFGQPAYDFGVFGLIEGLFLGVVLRESSQSRVFGTFSLVVATLMLEIGIEGQFLAAVAYSAYLGKRGFGNED